MDEKIVDIILRYSNIFENKDIDKDVLLDFIDEIYGLGFDDGLHAG